MGRGGGRARLRYDGRARVFHSRRLQCGERQNGWTFVAFRRSNATGAARDGPPENTVFTNSQRSDYEPGETPQCFFDPVSLSPCGEFRRIGFLQFRIMLRLKPR
jgi:hypothetical protein